MQLAYLSNFYFLKKLLCISVSNLLLTVVFKRIKYPMSLKALRVLSACWNYGTAICYSVITSLADAFLLFSCDNNFSVVLEYKYSILFPA